MSKRIAVVPDTEYRSEGSYAYDTEAETRAAVEHEQAKLDSGEWAAYGVVVYKPCDNPDHGPYCPHAGDNESVWGVVTNAGHDGVYDSLKAVTDSHIRWLAEGMWGE